MFITKSNHLSRLSKPPKTWNNRVALLLSTISLTLTSIAQAQTTTPIYSGSGPLAVGGQLGFGQIPLPPTPGVTIADISNNTLDTNIGLGTIGYVGYSNYTYNPTSSALELVNPDFPVLDANLGYSIDFYVLLVNTNTFGSNRAALSLTVISDDGTGIELGFVEGTLTDRVFAQDVNFDNETLSTTGTLDLSLANHFVLQIYQGTFTLQNDSGITMLTGPTRTYNFDGATSSPPLPFDPYETPSFFFVGDNTDQADGYMEFGPISITVNAAPIPPSPPTLGAAKAIPTTGWLALLGLFLALIYVLARRKRTF